VSGISDVRKPARYTGCTGRGDCDGRTVCGGAFRAGTAWSLRGCAQLHGAHRKAPAVQPLASFIPPPHRMHARIQPSAFLPNGSLASITSARPPARSQSRTVASIWLALTMVAELRFACRESCLGKAGQGANRRHGQQAAEEEEEQDEVDAEMEVPGPQRAQCIWPLRNHSLLPCSAQLLAGDRTTTPFSDPPIR
jgi:hypothetical protein